MNQSDSFGLNMRWRPVESGGRRTGAPPGPRFYATAAFVAEGDPRAQYSIELELDGDRARARFLAPEVVERDVLPGAGLWILDGSRIVADAVVTEE
jgi:hypothetical protein